MEEQEKINAEVIAVYPDKVKVIVDSLEDFQIAGESLNVRFLSKKRKRISSN